MRNFVQDGDVLTLTAPSGGVVAGQLYVIGNIPVVATHDAAVGAPFTGMTSGVFDLAKVGSQAWTVGARINWNAATGVATTATTTGFFPIGVAVAAVGSGAGETTGRVRLNGVGVAAL
jgi:predicted RecA/RadA family phage recombinase